MSKLCYEKGKVMSRSPLSQPGYRTSAGRGQARAASVVAISMALVAALVFPASVSAGGNDKPLRKESPRGAEAALEAVQQIYDKVARYTAASGTPVELALSDCRVIDPPDFSTEAFSDLFDLAPGPVLQLSAAVLSDRGLGVEGVSFRAQWADAVDEADAWGVVAAVRGASIAEILAQLSAQGQGFDREVESIVSCGVTATAEGKFRAYRAAFFFSPGDGVPTLLADPVLHGLHRLAREVMPPVRDFAELRRKRSPVQGLVNQTEASTTTCNVDDREGLNSGLVMIDHQEHASGGSHLSNLQLKGRCTETSDCVSRCTPSFEFHACVESGSIATTVPRTHRVYKEERLEGDSKVNAPSYCSGSMGCAIESCPFGVCKGVTFSYSRSGGGFSIGGGSPLWNGSLSDTFACPAPIPYVPTVGGGGTLGPFYPEPDPYGGGGGGGGNWWGGSGGFCFWRCVSRWNGSYYVEDCDLIC